MLVFLKVSGGVRPGNLEEKTEEKMFLFGIAVTR